MHALIITIMAIMLTSAMVVSTVNYLPSWQASAQLNSRLVETGFERLERAYQVYAAEHLDVPAAPDASADGGLTTHFGALLGFVPRAPDGFFWYYGQRPLDAGPYAGMHYFCLAPLDAVAGTEGVVRGTMRLRRVVPQDQVVFAAACGATADWVAPTQYPQALHTTYYVSYVPGMD